LIDRTAKRNIGKENEGIRSVQILKQSHVAELRWDGASEIIHAEEPEQTTIEFQLIEGCPVEKVFVQ